MLTGLAGLLALLAFDLAGEAAVSLVHLRFPGPVLGMLLYLVALILVPGLARRTQRGAELLLRHMTLFFVPAAVGILTQIDLLRAQWLPLTAAVVVSTVLAMLAGAWAFAHVARRGPRPETRTDTGAGT